MRKITAVLLSAIMILGLVGCGEERASSSPITLTIWHVYGEQTASPLNDLIKEFNDTVGMNEGIKVQVSLVSNTNTIHDSVLRAANNEPGATDLPDMFISYPKTVLAMPDSSVLVDYRDYFSEDELKDFIPEFIDEGEIDGRLLVFPIAKSTEILYVNKTLFDRFAADTGAKISDLETWEGLFDTAKEYCEWSEGKNFFVHDYHFNYFQVGVESLGEDFFDGEEIAFGKGFEKAWEPYADACLNGAVWLEEGYATEPLRTGDAIASVASSASVLYYSDTVTYPDNRTEDVEIISMPVPTFKGGKKMVMQRGAGICTVKSDPKREAAAATFIKWLCEPTNNDKFVTSLGYMPVTNEGFNLLEGEVENLESAKYKSLYDAYIKTQKEYEFYSAPKFESYLETETAFEKDVRAILRKAVAGTDEDTEKLSEECLEELKNEIRGN
ncbi:MAG: extracellular solute-binding protein [Lachnospiraceae bacterium]|nr:extracellular solute-binding protein [Lachnospiraceae bacterium]